MTKFLFDTAYSLSLKSVGILVGLALLAAHLGALFNSERLKPWLRTLPRNYSFGVVLLLIDFLWCFVLVTEMDLGEFYTLELLLQAVIVGGYFLVSYYVRDFLAVRAIGLGLILVASPILESAFLQPPFSRLLLVALSFAWILFGIFWVGLPYLLRDAIIWITNQPKRWQIGCILGAAYGLVTLLCAILFY